MTTPSIESSSILASSSSGTINEASSWKNRLVARMGSQRFRAGMATAIFVSISKDLCVAVCPSLNRSLTWCCPFITLSSLLTGAASQGLARRELPRDLEEQTDWTKQTLVLIALIYITYVVAQTVINVPIGPDTFQNGLSPEKLIPFFGLAAFALASHLLAVSIQNRPRLANAMLAVEGLHLALIDKSAVFAHVAQAFAAGALARTINHPDIEE